MAQVEFAWQALGPEFRPWYCQKEKERKELIENVFYRKSDR
jgi:hypothetical protein